MWTTPFITRLSCPGIPMPAANAKGNPCVVKIGAVTMINHVARRPSHARVVDLVESIPQDHRTFFRHLPLVIEEHDLFVIHARWSPEDSDAHPDLAAPIAQNPKLKHRVLWERFSDEE